MFPVHPLTIIPENYKDSRPFGVNLFFGKIDISNLKFETRPIFDITDNLLIVLFFFCLELLHFRYEFKNWRINKSFPKTYLFCWFWKGSWWTGYVLHNKVLMISAFSLSWLNSFFTRTLKRFGKINDQFWIKRPLSFHTFFNFSQRSHKRS